MKATVSAILDGARYGHPRERHVELHFAEATFAFNNLRVPERLLDLGAVNVGDVLDVNFLPESMMAQVNEALADGIIGLGPTSQCPYCGEHFIELGEGKLSHYCAEESAQQRRPQ